MAMFENLSWSDALGMVGVVLYIGSYFALQAGFIRGQGYLYASLNTLAAVCVLLSLAEAFNLSSAVIQATYIAISVFGIIRFYLASHRIKFTDEERAFLAVAAPTLGEVKARKLLDLGLWTSMVSGTVLTEEGERPDHLFFLLDGEASVRVGGREVARLGGNSIVGEMSCLTDMPASATVVIDSHSRVFSLDLATLNAFLARNGDAKLEIQGRMALQVSDKLVRANAAMSAHPASAE